MDITFVNGNNVWKFHDNMMIGTLWKRVTDGRTDRRMDRRMDSSAFSAAWSQLKIWYIAEAWITRGNRQNDVNIQFCHMYDITDWDGAINLLGVFSWVKKKTEYIMWP